ncbi:unnamed protein product [Caenorhabditis brenneri]
MEEVPEDVEYIFQNPPDNMFQFLQQQFEILNGGHLPSTSTQIRGDLQIAYQKGIVSGYAKMASFIISDELEISKMDTEAIYAAINGLTSGHEEANDEVGQIKLIKGLVSDVEAVIRWNFKAKEWNIYVQSNRQILNRKRNRFRLQQIPLQSQ